MDANAGSLHSIRHTSNSSSSAIDISGTGPDTHRCLSWSNAGDRQEERLPSRLDEDPTFSDSADRSFPHDPSFPDVSAATLLSTVEPDADTPRLEEDDDRTRLTAEAEPTGGIRWSTDDPERVAGIASRLSRRHTSSSLGDTVANVFRRASTRVAGIQEDGPYVPLQEDGKHADAGSEGDHTEEVTQPDAARQIAHPTQPPTHLRGRALGFLGPKNPLRVALYKLLINPYTEPTVLTLIIVNVVALVVQASRTLLLPPTEDHITVKGYFHAWEDFVIFVLFIIFTIEALGRICIAGLLLDPEVHISSLFSSSFSKVSRTMSTNPASHGDPNTPLKRSGSLARGYTLRRVYDNVAKPLSLPLSSHARTPSSALVPPHAPPSSASNGQSEDPESRPTFLSRVMKSDVRDSDPNTFVSLPFRLDLQVARSKIERNIPYLRQGWGRIDFIAVIGFWVSFALATTGLERGIHHIGIYRALSVLRVARLLAITNGTATIMRSLKIARPLLWNVLYFIFFAMVLFSVIGVQSFKRSLRRSCTLLPVLGADPIRLDQTCGGHIDATTLAPSPYLYSDGTPASITKGFICPLGQVCQEGENPFHGVESFDTVYYAALQIVVLASASSWAPVMYQIIASEYVVASIFFIFGVLVLNFWLFNLLVAVITNSFSAIRAGTKRSAFGAAPLGRVVKEPKSWFEASGHHAGRNYLKVWWSYTRWFWVLLALVSLVVQATATADMSTTHQRIINMTELIITLAFDVEIVIRIAVELPDWRNFFLHGSNMLDLFVAVGCSVIQIPPIRNSRAYPWLTVFQLARFFRVLLVVPRMKPLMLTVFGNMYGLVNMILFLLLITFLAALVCIQLIQGDMPGTAALNFSQLFNSFLGVYQILSGENWTALLYDVTDAELTVGQAITVCTFLCCWLLFSNFIVMQMFIAVINENFEVAEEAKRAMQSSNKVGQHSKTGSNRLTTLLNPYRWFKRKPSTVNVENPSSTSVLREPETFVPQSPLGMDRRQDSFSSGKSRHLRQRSFSMLYGVFAGDEKKEEIPLLDLHRTVAETRASDQPMEEEIDQGFVILTRLKKGPSFTEEAIEDVHRIQTEDLIRKHATYDKTFWIFSQSNPLRSLCQKIVHPSGGDRFGGAPPSEAGHTIFQITILLAVLGSVITEAVATPLYRHNYYTQHGAMRGAWFHITEATFGLILVVEFLIKIVADGFLFGPNAYVRNIWNILDFVILAGVLVNVTFTLVFVSGLSRFIRALKALQALRFMTLIDKMRSTFEDLILAGFIRILDAAILAMLYLIPFSVWGTNIFAGLMNGCNDVGVSGIGDCTNEYVNAIHENNFGFLLPRVWDIPSPTTTFSFDNFHSSLLILFEIVSQTGWVDVMVVAMSITGKGKQPQTNVAQANAIFFVVYNLLGAVIILTLFVSIIIGNFASRTGSAYVTEAQREWIDLQKLIKRLKPSKRPKKPPIPGTFRAWCYDRAIHKHGWWTRMMTLLFVVQIIVLMTQALSPETAADWHNIVLFIITLIYVVDTVIRLYGLGWHAFRANGWNLFDVLVSLGSFITTLFARLYPNDFYTELLQKLFLVSISFKLVQKVGTLNQLFKTGTASLPVILNLLGLWLTLFIFFAIMYTEVFGMTKWYSAENSYQNYQTMGSAFLMLVSLSTGEGWNQFMHDYALTYPRCTQISEGVYQTDCGSIAWAFTLFIAWNLLSMYIFVNMFTGVIVESFSYVFQSTGGVLKSITRHETRAFKKAWAKFSNPETRLLEHRKLAPFLAKLDGIFEVRIYPPEHSRASILAVSKKDNQIGGVSPRKLNRELNKIDFEAVRRRRAVYTRIYHEANVLCRHNNGISFTDMLLLLAHHTLIDEEEALELKELKVRREMLKLVDDLVALDRVRSQLRMWIHRRRYLMMRERARAAGQGISSNLEVIVEGSSAPGIWASQNMESSQGELDRGKALYAEYESTSPTSSPRTLVPSPEAMERTESQDDMFDQAEIIRSIARRRSEEMRLLQAEESDT